MSRHIDASRSMKKASTAAKSKLPLRGTCAFEQPVLSLFCFSQTLGEFPLVRVTNRPCGGTLADTTPNSARQNSINLRRRHRRTGEFYAENDADDQTGCALRADVRQRYSLAAAGNASFAAAMPYRSYGARTYILLYQWFRICIFDRALLKS